MAASLHPQTFRPGQNFDLARARLQSAELHRKSNRPSILRYRIHIVEFVSKRSGVIARVKHKKTRAHVPVERVMNSIGFAPRPSVKPSQIKRSRGKIANRKINNFIKLYLSPGINKTSSNPSRHTYLRLDRHNRYTFLF